MGLQFFCVNTEIAENHSNPYDRLYDSSGYRVTLYEPVWINDNTVQILYGSILGKNGDSLPADFRILSANIIYLTSSFSDSAITNIQNGNLVSEGSSTAAVYTSKDSFANKAQISGLSKLNSYSFILEIGYIASSENAILHSNIKIITPEAE